MRARVNWTDRQGRASAMQEDRFYAATPDGVYVPRQPVKHREEEYDSAGCEVLSQIQSRHFWYLGRHRFILHSVMREIDSFGSERISGLDAMDLGGGCGGWIAYLNNRPRERSMFRELALGDSSVRALELAEDVVGPSVRRYQVDIRDLPWTERWDVVFLLDVLEHIPDDLAALRRIAESLRPGGLLFVTAPALRFFWTYNDDLVHHVRRYSRTDFRNLAEVTGLVLCRARYFMFFLSPLLLLSRMRAPNLGRMSREDIQGHHRRTRRTPPRPVNEILGFIFALESPLGWWLPFPWGTSILGVFRKGT